MQQSTDSCKEWVIQLAVDEINAAGGINGKQIEYKFEDDQADSEKSVNAYNTLKDWGNAGTDRNNNFYTLYSSC